MTMNYCGRCGSANGATARFCRQCGADLSSQTAASSSSTPFNIEFSTKSVVKNPESEAKPALPENEPSPGTASLEDASSDQTPDASITPGGGEQDPKAISQSLRRIRASGPLILEAIKQNDPQSMERINEIIAQSVQGLNEAKAPVESTGASTTESRGIESGGAAAPPAPPPIQQVKDRESNQTKDRSASEAAVPQATRTISADQGAARQTSQALIRATSQGAARAGAKTPAQTDAQTTPHKVPVAPAQSIVRRVTSWLSVSNSNRSISHAPLGGGHSGPSTVLMQASGFKPKSSIGPKVILGIIALAVLLAVPIYFMFRDRLLTQAQPVDGDLNLISPEDQSARLVKEGASERAQGKYSAAIEHFHHALELTPNNLEIRFLLAQTYISAGRIDDAARSCREILRIAPEHLDARLQLAEIYRAKGNWSAAYREYRNIIELNQSSSQAADALAAIESQQAVAQMDERAAEKAMRGRRRSRMAIPSLPVAAIRNPVPLLTPGLSEIQRVNPPAALSGTGVEDKPDPRGMAEVHKRFGVRYLNIREFRAAINEFIQALNLTPDDKDLCYFIGSSYHGLGLLPEAYNYYSRVDAGPYVGPAESGAKQTRKAAQEANKHRIDRNLPAIKNELEDINENKPSKPKSVMNRILDSLR
ncbi:MAG TPA: tetratricopeptide repeat protein [Blastocatellia bacterium]|nr:tetratricopeptide repeat protein [Blastocatellia bacterium]